MQRLVAALAILAMACVCSASISVRTPAPTWSGKAALNNEIIELSSAKLAGKWVVLFFYPLDFTFVCPTEIVELSNKYDEIKALGAEVVGVSVDSIHTHLAWTRTDKNDGGVGNIKFPLLADITKEISRAFGVLMENADDDHVGVAMRGTYIVDPQGIVRSFAVTDEPIGRNIPEIIRLLEAAQFSAANKGKGCPANWKKGDSSITANRKDSLNFFKGWGQK